MRVEGIGKPNDGNEFFGANGRAASLYQMMGKQQNELRPASSSGVSLGVSLLVLELAAAAKQMKGSV